MIFVTGDCHSDFHRFNTKIFPEQKKMTKDDVVIIAGDFGGIWCKDGETKEEKCELDRLNNRPFTTVFVDGNHECYPQLYKYPVKEWHGGKVHEIRPSVLHLMRGEIFDIQGKKFFAFGGARSHDISDGILDYEDEDWRKKARELERDGRTMFRVNGLSWWPEEMPTEEEMQHGIENLEKVDFKVDYVISHCGPQSVVSVYSMGKFRPDELTMYFNGLLDRGLQFKGWILGHYHANTTIMGKFYILYEQISEIEPPKESSFGEIEENRAK